MTAVSFLTSALAQPQPSSGAAKIGKSRCAREVGAIKDNRDNDAVREASAEAREGEPIEHASAKSVRKYLCKDAFERISANRGFTA